MFNLKAGNGEIIGKSEMYSSKSACENGIQSVMKNAPEATEVKIGSSLSFRLKEAADFFQRLSHFPARVPSEKHADKRGLDGHVDQCTKIWASPRIDHNLIHQT